MVFGFLSSCCCSAQHSVALGGLDLSNFVIAWRLAIRLYKCQKKQKETTTKREKKNQKQKIFAMRLTLWINSSWYFHQKSGMANKDIVICHWHRIVCRHLFRYNRFKEILYESKSNNLHVATPLYFWHYKSMTFSAQCRYISIKMRICQTEIVHSGSIRHNLLACATIFKRKC